MVFEYQARLDGEC